MLNYTLRTAAVMDGETEVAAVHGLSLNEIVQLIMLNRDAANAIFEELNGRSPEEVTEADFLRLGSQLIEQVPVFVAQLIAVATNSYESGEQNDGQSPVETILSMPAGLQLACMEKTAELTFVGTSPKKLLALAFKTAQGRDQSLGA